MRWALALAASLFLALGAVAFSGQRWLGPLEDEALQLFAPLQRTAARGTSWVAQKLTLEGRQELSRDNATLRKTVAQLTQEIVRLREAEQENERLRALLNYVRQHPGQEYLLASIIGWEPDNLVRAVLIDRGTDHGVQEGMVIVAEGGLVGKVARAYQGTAKVRLITDPGSAVSALIQRSRVQGLSQGHPNGRLKLAFVARGEDVTLGDVVLTSGLGGGFPKGVFIGQVTNIRGEDADLFQEITVEPSFRPLELEQVLVLMDFMPQLLP